MEELFTPLLLLSLWRVQFATGQSFDCLDSNALKVNQNGYFVEGAGRVEICHCFSVGGCQWVTVPVSPDSVSWGWKNALVACREASPAADYGVINPILQDALLSSIQAPSTQLVLPFYVVCDGSEDRVSECDFQPSSSNISHARDAYVRCRTTVPVEGSVRLVGVTSVNQQGIVEFYVTGRGWVTGCSDSWDAEDANLTCISLGYDSGVELYYFAAAAISPVGVYDISCTGNEADITLCSYSTTGFCSDTRYRAGVSCTHSDLEAGSIRLFPSKSDGFDQRVEILYNDRWGSVCGLTWDDEDGSVACSSLGYDEANVNSDPTFNTGNEVRPIWISFVGCSGSESSIMECSISFEIGYQSSCDHSDDAALACSNSGLSGGEIAGIVIGSLCAIGLIGLCFHFSEKNKKKQAALRQRRQQEPARGTTARVETNRVASIIIPREPETAATSTFRSTSTGDGANASTLPRVESDTELRKGAPPSYDEALLFTGAPVNNVPPTNNSESSAQPETSLPPYPVPNPVPTHPNTSSSNLPYPDASSPTAPYPTVGVPYPTTNITLAPYPPSSDAQAPYPQEPGPGNVQNYPPPTNPGYPPPTSPGLPPPTNPAYPPAAPVNYPLQPFTAPTYLPNQPVQDVGAPLPPVLQPHEESNM